MKLTSQQETAIQYDDTIGVVQIGGHIYVIDINTEFADMNLLTVDQDGKMSDIGGTSYDSERDLYEALHYLVDLITEQKNSNHD